MNEENDDLSPLSDREFHCKYGHIAKRLFTGKRDFYLTINSPPRLAFADGLGWPVLPLPGACADIGDPDDPEEDLPDVRLIRAALEYTASDDDSLSPEDYRDPLRDDLAGRAYSFALEIDVYDTIWKPVMALLAEHGAGTVVFFDINQFLPGAEPYLMDGKIPVPIGAEVDFAAGSRWPDKWYAPGLGDSTVVIDETGDWAFHQNNYDCMTYVTATPLLMDRIIDVVGGKERLEKRLSLWLAFRADEDGIHPKYYPVFRDPPYPNLNIRKIPTIFEHLEKHPWLDEVFKEQ